MNLQKYTSKALGIWLWAKIQRNPWRQLPDLENLQKRKFKSVLDHAFRNTLFYHRLYRNHKISPSDIRSIDDISKLPIISKNDLKRCSV